MLMKEMTQPTQGSREMMSRILDLLYIQVVRAWATGPDAPQGWLTGAMDPIIGEAIAAIHAEPADPWTIDRLAQICNLSRSAFAERFARKMGHTPAAYVALLRLADAADLLQESEEAVGEIATKCGYRSEAAFSRAFSKHFGMPPSRWRREKAAVLGTERPIPHALAEPLPRQPLGRVARGDRGTSLGQVDKLSVQSAKLVEVAVHLDP